MGIIGGQPGYWMLRALAPRRAGLASPHRTSKLAPDAKLRSLFGDDFFEVIEGKTVLDFGCGTGRQVVEMALRGAQQVIGLDIQERGLAQGRELARQHFVSDQCTFTTQTNELADVIISKDAFEHFGDPAAILFQMSQLLKPGGMVLVAFGPTWFHPYGGHSFSVFPWAHLIFSERALLRWRATFKSDGATKFSEVEGGLNQMTIRRFEHLVEQSPLDFEAFETVPIKGIALLKSRLFREIGSSIVRCKLKLKSREHREVSERAHQAPGIREACPTHV